MHIVYISHIIMMYIVFTSDKNVCVNNINVTRDYLGLSNKIRL